MEEGKKPDSTKSTGELSDHSDPREEKPSPPPASSDFPDGGTKAWLTVLGGWCCCLCSYGWLSSIGVFQTYYEQRRLSTYSPSTISWILSVQVFCLSGFAPINGKIFDSYGCRGLIMVGTFLHVFGLMMVSLSDQYYQIFLAQSICSGVGTAMLFHGATNAVATWFQRRRGLAIGLVSSGASIGGVIVPIMFNRLIPTLGFGWSVRIIAFLFLALQLLAILTVRSRLNHTPKPFSVLEFVRPFRERTYLLNAIGCFFVFWGILIPFNYITLAAESSGMDPNLALYLIPIVNAATFPGRVLPLWAGDHVGRFNIAVLFTFFGFVLVLAVWIPAAVHTDAPTLVFAVLYGLPLGCFAAILPALVAQISDVRQIGVRIGTTFFVTAFAGLTGNPIAGALVARGSADAPGGDYLYLKVFCGLTIAVGCGFLAAARVCIVGPGLTKKA